MEVAGLMWGHKGYSAGTHLRISLLIDPLTEYWMVDDTSLLDSDSIIPIVYLALIFETQMISCMSTPLFDTKLIGLEVLNLVQLVIRRVSQPYESY